MVVETSNALTSNTMITRIRSHHSSYFSDGAAEIIAIFDHYVALSTNGIR